MNQKAYHTDSHRMGRRSYGNNYRRPGIYHVTMTVNDRRQQPLGRIVGDVSKPDGDPDAPHVALSEIGSMVEHELLNSITAHYPMVEVQDYVIMPDHVHCIIVVKNSIISKNGRETHLGQLISGFKKGCSRRYWEMTGQSIAPEQGGMQGAAEQQRRKSTEQRGNPTAAKSTPTAATAATVLAATSAATATAATAATVLAATSAATATAATAATTTTAPTKMGAVRPAGCPQAYVKVPSRTTTGRQPLFSDGYVDVLPLEEGQLERQRAYIRNNPRYRLLRSQNRSSLYVQRGGIDTALSLSALKGYLKHECGGVFNEELWTMVSQRLLMNGGYIDCDSYGNRLLLNNRLLPVVCHRKDQHLFSQQKEACLAAARNGAVLVSAHISKNEQDITHTVMDEGYPVVSIEDQGMAEMYQPSEQRQALCVDEKLLIVTPWIYRYRPEGENISVLECKTMNCLAQALCKKKDNWWK